MAMKDYLATLKSEAPRTIQTTGKIYVKDNYIFVSDPNEGIHIIDNSHPAAPENIAFLKVMGNVDMAIKGNILYADSYSNLSGYHSFTGGYPNHRRHRRRFRSERPIRRAACHHNCQGRYV